MVPGCARMVTRIVRNPENVDQATLLFEREPRGGYTNELVSQARHDVINEHKKRRNDSIACMYVNIYDVSPSKFLRSLLFFFGFFFFVLAPRN